MKGVENVFTQHTTVLKDIMDSLLKGRLSEESYPTLGNEMNLARYALTNFHAVDIINYFVQFAEFKTWLFLSSEE